MAVPYKSQAPGFIQRLNEDPQFAKYLGLGVGSAAVGTAGVADWYSGDETGAFTGESLGNMAGAVGAIGGGFGTGYAMGHYLTPGQDPGNTIVDLNQVQGAEFKPGRPRESDTDFRARKTRSRLHGAAAGAGIMGLSAASGMLVNDSPLAQVPPGDERSLMASLSMKDRSEVIALLDANGAI